VGWRGARNTTDPAPPEVGVLKPCRSAARARTGSGCRWARAAAGRGTRARVRRLYD